jgi:hypothetical protein
MCYVRAHALALGAQKRLAFVEEKPVMHMVDTHDYMHSKNILAVRFHPHAPDLVATSSADQTFKLTNLKSREVWVG